jgi:hypothetical protein
VAIVPPNAVPDQWRAFDHLENLTVAFWLAHLVAVHDDAVSHLGIHHAPPFVVRAISK